MGRARRRALVLIAWFVATPLAAQPQIRIGIISDGEGKRCFVCSKLIVEEITALTRGEFDVRFPADKRIAGDWTHASVRAGLDRLLRDDGVDLVLAMGPLAAVEAGTRGALPKPVIAPIVVDPQLQGLPLGRGTSGVRNFTYVAPVKNFERDIAAFKRVVDFRNLALLIDRGLLDALPLLRAKAAEAATQLDFDLQLVPVDDNVYDLLARLPSGIDGVFVTPLLRLDEPAMRALASALIARKLPSFSLLGRSEVEFGLLASMAADDDGQRLARRVALNVQRILLGEDPGGFPIGFGQRERLVLNMETARAIGVSPSWDVLTEAYKLNETYEQGPQLTLRRALDLALRHNLSLAASRYDVDLARDRLEQARSGWRPRLSVGGRALAVDADRAAASFGSQPERTTSASVTLSQVIYADAVNADVEVSDHLLRVAREDLTGAELDTVLNTARAFLDVLSAWSLERIRIDNLETTRANLDLAETREAIGVSGPAEVIRWEREIADNLKSLAEARSARHRATARLNLLLHGELDRELLLADLSVANAGLLATDPRVIRRVDNPFDLQVFSRFMVDEGLRNAAELRSLDAGIEARRRTLLAARRTRWPTVSAQASVDNRLSEGGAGTDASGATDDTEWSVALNLQLPLYEGGGIGAAVAQARDELLQLGAQRAALAEQIEARVVDAMYALHASYPSLEYTAQAADAARRNLESVRGAYSQGVVSILDLLDAQTAALASNEAAAAAGYELLADFFDLQRAIGRFDYFLADGERAAWFERLQRAFEEAGR